jgi:prepilin-type processing-associated H-X9-DG protein
LIELLTVIAIIGILAAILIPTVGKVRNSAQSARCISNLRQVGQQIMAYANDSKGNLPNLQALTNSAVLDPRVVSNDGKQLAYHLWPYYTRVPLSLPYIPGRGSVHEMFICPAIESAVRTKIATTSPSGSGDQTANVAQSYIINDIQSYGTGAARQTVFGYNGAGRSFNLYDIERKLRTSTSSSIPLSRIWSLQDGDTLLEDEGGTARTSQATFIAGNKPSHGSSRNRLFLDGSVTKLTLQKSTRNNY